MPIRHAFNSPMSDGGDPNLLQPSNWNDHHVGGDRLWVPGSDPYGLDDEFDNSSIGASWILVNPSPVRATWTEGNDVLSCYVAPGNAAGQSNAIVKAISLSPPVTIETAIRYMTPYAYNYFMHGLVFSNSSTWGSGVAINSRNYTANDQAVSGYHDLQRQATAYNSDTSSTGSSRWQWVGSTLYAKLVWSATNQFGTYISPDGVSWITISEGQAYTLTPTFAGLYTSTWAGGSPCIGTFEYFRVY